MKPISFRNHYLPDLARPLWAHRFKSIEEIVDKTKKGLKAIPENIFIKCFDDWKKRWHKCIASDGDYVNGDEIDLVSK